MRSCRCLDVIRDRQPQQLIAGQNLSLDVVELAKARMLDSSLDQLSCLRPNLVNINGVYAEQIRRYDRH